MARADTNPHARNTKPSKRCPQDPYIVFPRGTATQFSFLMREVLHNFRSTGFAIAAAVRAPAGVAPPLLLLLLLLLLLQRP